MLTEIVTPEVQQRQDQELLDPMEVEPIMPVVRQLPMLPAVGPHPASPRMFWREVLSASQRELHGIIHMAISDTPTLHRITTTPQSTTTPRTTRPIIP